MATVKRIADLGQYAGVLPYASEMFGIYQPLLGWKSRRTAERIERGLARDKARIIRTLQRQIAPAVRIEYDDAGQVRIDISAGQLRDGAKRVVDSVVLERISQSLPPYQDYDPSVWADQITPDRLDTILKKDVVAAYTKGFAQLRELSTSRRRAPDRESRAAAGSGADLDTATFEKYLAYESQVAGLLLLLVKQKRHAVLEEIFYVSRDSSERAGSLSRILSDEDPTTAFFDLDSLDPSDVEQLKGVSLSPISVVHLFRQYFFELDTFLGTSERHVWLSPGSSVELVEVHTRRTTIERTVETTLDILTKSESATTSQEELSEAVKDENSQDIKAGASVTASYATVQATASFDYAGSQKQARETTHKRNREQTDKLSSEIRKNFKTTFKSTTEVTDTSSTRHLLANNTSELINYELRRKMRQVGVQLQDIGTYLCWQTYVDDPGAALGLAKLIHIAKPAELDAIPHPEELPALQPFQESKLVTIPFISIDGTDADNEGEIYVNGIESDNSEFLGSEERIQHRFRQEFVCPRVDYELADVSFDAQGKPVSVSRADGIDNSALPRASFTLNLDSADFQGQNSLQVQLILHWSPLTSANQEIEAKNKALQAQFSAAEKQAFEKAAVETLKERVDVDQQDQGSQRRGPAGGRADRHLPQAGAGDAAEEHRDARRPDAPRGGRAHQFDLRRGQDAVLRVAGVVAAPASSLGAAAQGPARGRRASGDHRNPHGGHGVAPRLADGRAERHHELGADPCPLQHGRLGRRGRRQPRQLLHHRRLRAGADGQLARLAPAARRRQHAQRVPERPLGQGRDADSAREGEGGDQLAQGRRRHERDHRRRHLSRQRSARGRHRRGSPGGTAAHRRAA